MLEFFVCAKHCPRHWEFRGVWGEVPVLKHLRRYGEDIINNEKNKIVSTAVKHDKENEVG